MPGVLQQPGHNARRAALAVGAGCHDGPQFLFGMAEVRQQSFDARQSGPDTKAVQAEQPARRFITGHKRRRQIDTHPGFTGVGRGIG